MKVCLQKNVFCISENNLLVHVNDVINVTVYIFFTKVYQNYLNYNLKNSVILIYFQHFC